MNCTNPFPLANIKANVASTETELLEEAEFARQQKAKAEEEAIIREKQLFEENEARLKQQHEAQEAREKQLREENEARPKKAERSAGSS